MVMVVSEEDREALQNGNVVGITAADLEAMITITEAILRPSIIEEVLELPKEAQTR